MPCSSSCPTGDHQSFGACLRAKNLQIADVGAHMFNTRQNAELDNYRDARAAGLQPATTRKSDVDTAWRVTDLTGTPYRADA